MTNKKAYFVDNETEEVYELSFKKKQQLEKKHPYWFDYNSDFNYQQLLEVVDFFKKHGKLVACRHYYNVFVGLVE
jgi:DNA modification methylase